MDIDADHLGIPETEYKTTIRMPSAEFQRIIRDLQVLGDTCTIAVTKEGVRFSVSGDLGTGNVLVRSTNGVDKEEEEVRPRNSFRTRAHTHAQQSTQRPLN